MTTTVLAKGKTYELETISFFAFGVAGHGQLTHHDAPDFRATWKGVLPWARIEEIVFNEEAEGE